MLETIVLDDAPGRVSGEPYPIERLRVAGEDLMTMVRAISPDAVIRTRLVAP